MRISMKYALMAGLMAAALAGTAAGADEDWIVVGGDGSAFGYDRASIKKDGARVSVRYGVYSATALPPPPSMTGSTLFGFTGAMTLNCQDKTFKTGETSYYFAYGGERTVAAAPNAVFEKPKPNDFHAFFFDAVCGGRKFFDSYGARTLADAAAAPARSASTTTPTTRFTRKPSPTPPGRRSPDLRGRTSWRSPAKTRNCPPCRRAPGRRCWPGSRSWPPIESAPWTLPGAPSE